MILPLLLLSMMASLQSRFLLVMAADCPLEFSWSNFSLAASACSNQSERAKCCRYINALVTVSVAHYAKGTGLLGVPSTFTAICTNSVSETLQLHGIPPNATNFCGVGTKIRVSYQCEGRGTVMEMLQSPNFNDVIRNCKVPLSLESSCRRCLNSGISYLHHFIGTQDNITLNTCRDAAFVALASQYDNMTAFDMADCFFSVQQLSIFSVNGSTPSRPLAPTASPSPLPALAPTQSLVGLPLKKHHPTYQLTLILGVGIMVTTVSILLFVFLMLLICKKSRELNGAAAPTETSWTSCSPHVRKSQEGLSNIFRRFSYKETKKATKSFSSIIGRGGLGTVYKAQFDDGSVAVVKRMNRVLESEEVFYRNMELLGRLHHRHLVSLRGYCIERRDRFLIYEYMENGSLKDHLYPAAADRTPLAWQTRIQIAIDVANALEYLHFYCDPPLCHSDIKPSNILLDEHFVAKVSDFGFTHASRNGAMSFKPVNPNIGEKSGHMNPENVATQELTEECDMYNYGLLLLELVTGVGEADRDKGRVEWFKKFAGNDSKLRKLVDPSISDSFDMEQLQVMLEIIQCCTHRERRSRPSIKQVLRMLHERLDSVNAGFVRAMEEEEDDYSMGRIDNRKRHQIEDARCLQSSSSTTRSYCSRSVLLENSP